MRGLKGNDCFIAAITRDNKKLFRGHHFLNKLNKIAGELLWCKRNKILRDVLLLSKK